MKEFKKIVVGIDYSEPSIQALKQAGRIAAAEGAALTALHVIVPSEVEEYGRYYTVSTEETIGAFRAELDTVLQRELGPAVNASSEAIIGVPYHDLLNWAEDGHYDLLVLGSHGQSAHPHGVGFFAARCVRHSAIPTLLVRNRHTTAFKSVIACVDFSEATPQVIETAVKVARDEGAQLHVVHASSPPWMRVTHVLYNTQTAENAAYKAQYREVINDQMQAIKANLPAAAEVHTIEHQNVNQGLINFLREHQADLAVLGRSGHTAKRIKQFIFGTTAERLIHRSPCSVLVIPPKSS